MTHRVLDVDLDAFVSPIAYWPYGARLNDEDYRVCARDDVERFLTTQCGLMTDLPLPGRQVVDHDEAFDVWADWMKRGILEAPFEVVHVDAHADLGMGDASWVHVMIEHLASRPGERLSPKRRGTHGMSAGNYLVFAIAARWLQSLVHVYPRDDAFALPPDAAQPELEDMTISWRGDDVSEIVQWRVRRATSRAQDAEPPDLPSCHFKGFDRASGAIQLKRYLSIPDGDYWTWPPPFAVEPEVPFKAIEMNKFRGGEFTHMILALSPNYTPPAADGLLPLIAQFFTPT
jgi:hypothetical protein